MKNSLNLFIFLFFSLQLIAVETDTSELFNLISKAEKELKVYNYEKAKIINDSAFIVNNKLNSEDFFDKLYQQKGVIFYKLQNFDSALIWIDISLEYGKKKLNNDILLAKSYYYKGNIHSKKVEREQCFKNLDIAIDLFDKNQNYKGKCRAINSKGLFYIRKHEFDTALVYYMESLEQANIHNVVDSKIKAMINIANVYIRSNKLDEALEIYDQAHKLCETINDSVNESTINVNVASIYRFQGNYDKALSAYLKLLKDAEKAKDKETVGLLCSNISNIYKSFDDYHKALKYVLRSLKIYEETNDESQLVSIYLNLGNVYSKLNNISEAFKYYHKSASYAQKNDIKIIRSKAYKNIADLHAKEDEFVESINYLNKYISLRDTIFEDKKLKYLSEFQAKFNKLQDETKIIKLENDNIKTQSEFQKVSYQRNLFLGILFLAFALVLSMILFFNWRNKKNKIISNQKIKELENQRKLETAKSVLEGEEKERKRIAHELHDGIGVLLSTASIHFSNVEDKSDPGIKSITKKAKEMLDKANSEIRNISHNMMPPVLSKFGIYEALLDIFEALDEDSDIITNFTIKGEKKALNENTEIMIYRFMQEIVNNTVKHADAAEVNCIMVISSNKLSIEYSDNGHGFDTNKINSKDSFGLNGIQSRIDFLNGKMKLDSNGETGTKYFINIPI
jgi:signal transduction histidine kinase